jgi:DNA-binding beta-propeller fold protein YncE
MFGDKAAMKAHVWNIRSIALATILATAAFSAEQGWYPHEGGLMKYKVAIRFGEEPEDTMPAGWKFGRVSSVATSPDGSEVYVFHRGKKADPLIVFDNRGKYLRSWGKGMFGNPHGLRVDHAGYVWVTDNGDHQVMKFTRDGKLLMTLGIKGKAATDSKTFNRPTDNSPRPIAGDPCGV